MSGVGPRFDAEQASVRAGVRALRDELHSRRDVLLKALAAGGAVAGLPALLDACAGMGGGDKDLVMLGPGGSYETAFKKGLVPSFEKQTGSTFTYSVGNSQQTLAKVIKTKDHPENDLVWASESVMLQGADAGAWATLDPKRFSNAGQLYQQMIPSRHVAMPIDLSVVGIEYNTKVFQEKGWQPPQSWNDLWDSKLAGHVVLENFPLAYGLGLTEMMSRIEGDLDKGWSRIIELLKAQKVTGVDQPAQVDQLLQQGAAWVTVNSDSRTYLLKGNGGPVDFVYPKEGVAGTLLYFMVMKNAPHGDLARQFVNYSIGKGPQGKLNTALVQGPANTEAQLDPSVAKRVAYGQAAIDKINFLDVTPILKRSDDLTDQWRAALGHS